ncbi:MAG: acyltransferase family protein [Mucilaginibacter sp.]
MESTIPLKPERLLSIDVMRGLIMIFLAGEACSVYESLRELHVGGVFDTILTQFDHHPWNGLRLWDLIQPSFMTIAGTAMYISYHNKQEKGISWEQNFKHILIRSLKLFVLGTAVQCFYSGKLVWELWNVLTQLSVTTIIAYLIINKSYKFQIAVSLALLIITEALYRMILRPGFDQPFVEAHNFGTYMDTVFMGKINHDGWVTVNFIPTAAHTIWGALAGKLLISDKPVHQKVKYLLIAGIIGLLFGFGLDLANVTPIIKRIATSSFTLASEGWVLLLMALLYWVIDIKKFNKYAWIAVVVGMNAIFIYYFFNTVGYQWFNGAVAIFVKGFLGFAGIAPTITAVISALVTWFLEWSLCCWLAKNKIFIKL